MTTNNAEISSLRANLVELQNLRNGSNVPAIIAMLDTQIEMVNKRLVELNPSETLEASITKAVNAKVDEYKPSVYAEEMHPVAAIKYVNGGAFSLLRHVLYANRRHEAIMARNASMVTSSTSSWKRSSTENTSPYDNEEDTLIKLQEEVKSCIEGLAQALCDFNYIVERAHRENIGLDVPGFETHRDGYDDFPSMQRVLQMDAAGQARRATERKVAGSVARALTPNIVTVAV